MTAWEAQVTTALVAIAGILNAAAPGSVPVFPATPPTDLGVISSASTKTLTE